MLLTVMALSNSPAAVSCMMRTCKALSAHGARYLLGREVSLYSEAAFMSFSSFLLKHPKHVHHLRKLTLTAPDHGLSEPTAHFFASILMVANPPISLLQLQGEWEEILGTHHNIRDAFISLASVRTLIVPFAGEKGIAMIRRMRSPLSTVDIGYEVLYDDIPPADRNALHPLSTLRNFHTTLERLVLSWSLGGEPGEAVTVTYPLVRTLEMDDVMDLPILPFIAAFPNLSVLEVETAYDGVEDVIKDHLVLTSIAARHRANQAAQDLHGSWKTLSQITGTLFGLYMLGIRCDVASLDLTIFDESMDWLVAVLRDTRPSTLVLTIGAYLGSSLLENDQLPRVLRQTNMHNLRNLTVKISLSKRDDQADMPTLLVCGA